LQLKSLNIMHTATTHSLKFENILKLHSRDRKRKLLKKVESTKKTTVGDFGYCEETGESIGIKRLIARLRLGCA